MLAAVRMFSLSTEEDSKESLKVIILFPDSSIYPESHGVIEQAVIKALFIFFSRSIYIFPFQDTQPTYFIMLGDASVLKMVLCSFLGCVPRQNEAK
jgi:hypothetical protein